MLRSMMGRNLMPMLSLPILTDTSSTYPSLKDVVKLDDLTFQLIFDNPQPTLPYSMVNFASPMYSPKNFDAQGDFNGLPQGTGPFKLIEHQKDQYSLLESYDGYYGEKAKTKHIRIRVIPDPDTRMSALKSGEIMGVMDIGAIPPNLAKELIEDPNFELSTAKSTISHYIQVNGKKAPFDNVKMRQAISLAIDRQQLVKELYLGYPTPTVNLLNATSPFYKDIPVEYNLTEAKRLATEVLGGEREKVDLLVPTYGLDRYPYKAQAELLQAELKELGLDVEIRILDSAAFKDAQTKGDYNLALSTQGLPNGDPYTILTNYLTSEGSSNITVISPGDPAVEALSMSGVGEPTQEEINAKRAELGLNDPLLVQYGRWVIHAVQGDLGTSYMTKESIAEAVLGMTSSKARRNKAAELLRQMDMPEPDRKLRKYPFELRTIWFNGKDITDFTTAQMRVLRTQMQLIFQHPDSALHPRMTILQSLMEPILLHRLMNKKDGEEYVVTLLEQVSGGQIQRIAIARALTMNPKLLVLDEPTSMLDVSVQAQVMEVLKHIQKQRGLSYLLISHDMELVRHASQQTAVMQNGSIVELNSSEAIMEQPQHEYTKQLVHAFRAYLL
ncbi:unnamed protein product, partial [Mesorhabditis spiculigera]